ncbi:MAG TPA: hypothetical protein VGT02_18050 [Methylomirabilota bacterium]|jgi:hypothetical protein|nr:hypothetical protein [Methylomirabilota bacterium]
MKGSLIAMAALCVAAAAAPASATDTYYPLTVDSLSGAQYSYGFFFANASAHASEPIIDGHLLVNGVAAAGLRIEEYRTGDGLGAIWKFTGYTTVVIPGDVLTLVVTDASGDSAQRQAVCIAPTTKKKSDLTAFCQ